MNSLVRPVRWKVNIRLTVSQNPKRCPSSAKGASFWVWRLPAASISREGCIDSLLCPAHARTGFYKPVYKAGSGVGKGIWAKRACRAPAAAGLPFLSLPRSVVRSLPESNIRSNVSLGNTHPAIESAAPAAPPARPRLSDPASSA